MSSFYNPGFVHVNGSSRSGNDGSSQIPQGAPLPPAGIQYPYLYWQSHPVYHWPSYPPHQPPSMAPERGTSDRLNYTSYSRWDDSTQGEGDEGDDWYYSSDVSSDASNENVSTSTSESTSESVLTRSGESKPPNFLGANALGLALAENEYYTSSRRVSPSNGAPRTDERQTPKYLPTPRFTMKHHTHPFTVEHQELQPLSPTGNNPSASRREPSAEEWSTRSLSAESVVHGLNEESSGGAFEMETCSVDQPEPHEGSPPCVEFPEPVWLNDPPPGPKPVINLKPTRPISITSEGSAATFSEFPFASYSSTYGWVHPPFVPGLSRSNVTAKPVRTISPVSVASEASSATFSFATHSPSIGSARSHGSFGSADFTSTIRPPGELHSVNEAKPFDPSATFAFITHCGSSEWVHPPFVPGLSRSNVTAKPIRRISAVSVASEASEATFSFASHSPSIGSVRSHGSFDSVDSTSTIRPPGELHSVNEAKPFDPSATSSFPNHGSSEWVHPPFVPGSSRSNVTPKPVRRISDVSMASEASSATYSFATHSPSIGSVRSHGSFDSVDSTSAVRPPGRLEFVNEAKPSVTLTPKQSTVATVDVFVDTLISPSQFERSARKPDLFSVENNDAKSNHDLERLASETPRSMPGGLDTPRFNSPVTTHSQESTPRKSNDRTGHVVNKLTQYVQVSEGPLRMWPNHGGTIVPVIDNNKTNKPSGSAIGKANENPFTTSTAPRTDQHDASPKSASSQANKPSETLNLCLRCAAQIQPTSSTPQATVYANESDDDHHKQSSGSFSPSNYHVVDYEEHRGYYYVIMGNEKGEEVGHMILRK